MNARMPRHLPDWARDVIAVVAVLFGMVLLVDAEQPGGIVDAPVDCILCR